MPPCTLEYSANLEATADIAALCRDVAAAILATGIFERGAIRVRALRCDAYAIADQLPGNAFLDMRFRIGAGRSLDDKRRAGDVIFEAAARRLASQLSQPHFALSLEVLEIDAALSWKRNAIHPRLHDK